MATFEDAEVLGMKCEEFHKHLSLFRLRNSTKMHVFDRRNLTAFWLTASCLIVIVYGARIRSLDDEASSGSSSSSDDSRPLPSHASTKRINASSSRKSLARQLSVITRADRMSQATRMFLEDPSSISAMNANVRQVKAEWHGAQIEALNARRSDYGRTIKAGFRGSMDAVKSSAKSIGRGRYRDAGKYALAAMTKPIVGACYEAWCTVSDKMDVAHHLDQIRSPTQDQHNLIDHHIRTQVAQRSNKEALATRKRVREWLAPDQTPLHDQGVIRNVDPDANSRSEVSVSAEEPSSKRRRVSK